VLRVLLLAAFLGLHFSCAGSGSPESSLDLTDVTFDDIQQRAMAAISRPGRVFHVWSTTRFDDEDYRTDAWLDPENHVARAESDLDARICYGDRITTVTADFANDAQFDALIVGGDPCLAMADYLATILTTEFVEREFSAASVQGEAAIAVKVKTDIYERNSDLETTIHLSEAYLPINLEAETSGFGSSELADLGFEFVERTTLATDFFEPSSLSAVGPRLASRAIKIGQEQGIDVYWAGPVVGGLTLAQGDYDNTNGSGLFEESTLELRYRGGDGISSDGTCARITHLTADQYERVLASRSASGESSPSGGASDRSSIAGGQVALYPDSGSALVSLDDGDFIEVAATCGAFNEQDLTVPAGQFKALVSTLRPYDGP
jgi:hypothetical protein